MKLLLPPFLLVSCAAAAEIATQTDWSGGPGVSGPTPGFGTCFLQASGVDWYSQPGAISISGSSPASLIGTYAAARQILAVDIDADGDMDVAASGMSRALSLWENTDGQGTSWSVRVAGAGYCGGNADASDMDLDGDMDLITGGRWYENADGFGELWVSHVIAGSGEGTDLTIADLDGDMDMDVIESSAYASHLHWYENFDGFGGQWVPHEIPAVYYVEAVISSGDMDGDGDVDMIVRNFDDPLYLYFYWLENLDGTGTGWSTHMMVADGFCWDIDVCDIECDGDQDVIMSSYTTGVWLSRNLDGLGGSWSYSDIDGACTHCYEVEVADFDLDGDLDAAGGYRSGTSDIAWLENTNGSGTQWETHLVEGSYPGVDGLFASDIDGDGGMDLVVSSSTAVHWLDMNSLGSSTAMLESSILYTGNDPDWGSLLWTAQTPGSTAVAFQVRASDDFSEMGEWSGVIVSPGSLEGVLADNASYFQYRAVLTTTDPDTTPVLEEVTVTWDPLGTGEGDLPVALELLPVTPNPCPGTSEIEFGLPAVSIVDLAVFDISGRAVQEVRSSEYAPGWHTVPLGKLDPGIYIVRVTAGGSEAAQSFVVIE